MWRSPGVPTSPEETIPANWNLWVHGYGLGDYPYICRMSVGQTDREGKGKRRDEFMCMDIDECDSSPFLTGGQKGTPVVFGNSSSSYVVLLPSFFGDVMGHPVWYQGRLKGRRVIESEDLPPPTPNTPTVPTKMKDSIYRSGWTNHWRTITPYQLHRNRTSNPGTTG